MKIIAHRGGMGRAPENSLIAFKQAIEDGADGIELDVMLTKDQEPIVIHLPFYSGTISRLTWAELKNHNPSVMHLDDVLNFFQGSRCTVFLEPKRVSAPLIEKLIAAVRKYKLESRTELISFFSRRRNIGLAHKLAPNLPCNVISLTPFTNWIGRAGVVQASCVFSGWRRYNYYKIFESSIKRRIKQCQEHGIKVGMGIANTAEDIRWLKDLGVDLLVTDNVLLAKEILI